MAIEANTPKDWGMRGATNITLPQFKGKSRQLIINIDDGYRPIIMDGITLGGKFKSASLDELNSGLATKLDLTAKAESAKVADTVEGANVTGTVANATNAINAAKATQDGLGRVISDTYATKGELEGIDTYAEKQDVLDAVDTALNGADPISAGDPSLDEIKTALAGVQADIGVRPIPNAYIVETWKSGSSWYRVWSDGFIEQGGEITTLESGPSEFSLNTAFTSKNYVIQVTVIDGYYASSTVYERTTSSFTAVAVDFNGSTYGRRVSWYACGY